MLTLIHHELKTGNIKIEKNFEPVPDITGDPVATGQVFLNLLINAKQAMPQGGGLSIGVRPSGDGKRVEISVRDSGTGIPAEILPKIFETAFSTKGDQGSGLGLSISKSIVEKQGGEIRVESVVGEGATFKIQFPIRSGEGINHG
jgi:signal transduction histidine kinase